MATDSYHRPVLVEEIVSLLEPAGEGEIMDGTVGGGGHCLALLEAYPRCRILAVDRDPEALSAARLRLAPHAGRVRFVEGRFDEAALQVGRDGPVLSGALLDLGVSAHQLDEDARGFTMRSGAPLDMRMGGSGDPAPTAAEILNEWEESELVKLWREYGEEPQARRLARAVLLLRGDRPFRTSDHLVEAMEKAYRRPATVKDKARIFAALRLAANREMESLDAALPALREALLPGGILTILAYHSLEDRRVKHAFREWSTDCICPPRLPVCGCGRTAAGELLTRRAITPSEAELAENPRARSARLRGWRKAA